MAYRHTTRSRILAEKRHLASSEASHAAAITVLDAVEDALVGFLNVAKDAPLAAQCAEGIAEELLTRLASLTREYARDIDATHEAIARLEDRTPIGAQR